MNKIKDLTTERGSDYGKPIDQFNTTQTMWNVWLKRRETGKQLPQVLENVLRHIVYLCIDKMVRLAETPTLQDNWDDIQGYASLWVSSVSEYNSREDANEDITH